MNPPPAAEQTTGPFLRQPLRLLWLSLALILAGNLGAYLVRTDGGQLSVSRIKLPTENGQWLTADLFRPRMATEKNPVPLVVVCPGFERSKETMDPYALELARRGMAVITIDPYNQGGSSATMQRRSASVEGYGVIPMVEYVTGTPNLNYIDKTRIGAAGYSAGGNAVLQSASVFGGRQGRVTRRTAARGADRAAAAAPNKLAGVFVGGYVLTLTDAVLATVNTNVAMDYAIYDEGVYRTVNQNADMRTAPEALRLVNSIMEKDQRVSAVEIGKHYGDPKQRTLRVVHNTPGNIHPLLPYDPRSIGHLVDFFTTVFDLEPTRPASSQTWHLKELCTLVSLVGALMFLVPFAQVLLQLPVFRPLAQPIPPPPPALVGRDKVFFWVRFAFTALLACYLFVPMVKVAAVLFPAATGAQQTWWFPQRMNNPVLLWAIANGAVGLLVFFLTHRGQGGSPAMLAIRTSARELALTLVLALVVFAGFYALLFASYAVFHVDFRFTFISATADFPVKMLLVALEYVPLFFIFYLANSIRVNCAGRFAGQREWVSLLVMGLGNSVGLMLILAIQYVWFWQAGAVYWTTEWLYLNLLFGIIPMMFVLPLFNRWFFRLTGRVYLGPMVTCLVFIMMMLTSNVCYIPLR